MPCWDVQGGEDFLGFGGQGVGGGEVVAVEVDADPGGRLEVPGYGQGGHNHGQVGLNSIALVVEDGAGSQVVLAHPERLPGRATARDTRRRPHRRPSGGTERKVA